MNLVEHDNPLGLDAKLAALVDLAHRQRVGPLRIDGEQIVQAVARRRAARARALVVGAVLVAAAVWLVWTGLGPGLARDRGAAQAEQAARVLDGHAATDQAVSHGDDSPSAVHVREAVVVPIDPPPAQPTAVLEVVPATDPATDPSAAADPPRASELARAAERAMTEHRPRDAIRLLDTLVRKYPTHATAKVALLDLGRLLREAGRRDEARCAYQLLRRRWPHDSSDLEQVIAGLGAGPECRGLRPVRTP